MKFSWMVNLYDDEGDCYQEGVFLFLGDDERTIVRFKSITELQGFLKGVAAAVPEIQEQINYCTH